MAQMFRVLGDQTRLAILMLLSDGELNVSALCRKLKIAQPSVSHHLGILRLGGMVNARRSGKQVFYSVRSVSGDRTGRAVKALLDGPKPVRLGPFMLGLAKDWPRAGSFPRAGRGAGNGAFPVARHRRTWYPAPAMSDATVKPVFVLHGDDAFLRDAYRREIVASAIGQADRQTCVAVFDATAELAVVLDELRTLPFLAPRRVVIIEGAEAFISAYRKQLENYLQSPSETATLVLVVSSWPKNTRLHKLVGDIGRTFDCGAPQKGLTQWLVKSASKRGKQIARDAAELLVEWVGNDLGLLNGEVEKLSLYVGQRETITAADVSAMVTASAGPAAFALTNALTACDAAGALKALAGMLTARGEEFRTLGMIASHLRRVLRAGQLAACGADPAAALNPRMPYRAKQAFLAMLARRPLRVLQEDFRRLIRADLGMKSGADAGAALQELVVGLCG